MWMILTVAGMYFSAFYKATYDDATRVAAEFNVVAPPMRKWKFVADEKKEGEATGFAKADFDDAAWKDTDVCLDSWSALGYHDYFGSMWYRSSARSCSSLRPSPRRWSCSASMRSNRARCM